MKPTLQAVADPTPAPSARPAGALEALGLDADFEGSQWLAQHGEQLAGMLGAFDEPESVTLPDLPAAA